MRQLQSIACRRVVQIALTCFASVSMGLAGVAAQPASAQSTILNCDKVIGVTPWNRQLSAVNTSDVLCYQVAGAALAAEVQRVNGAALIEMQVSRGAFDVFVFIAPATSANVAEQLNDTPITAGSNWRSFAFNNIAATVNYVIAVAPASEARGNYRLRVRVAPGAVPATPIPLPTPAITFFPTTSDAPCSRFALSLSGLCIDPFPVAFNGTLSVLWRIPDFRSGELDMGDGRGFVGPIAWQQKVNVPNIVAPRVIRLHWTDTSGRQFVDSILAPVGPSPASTPTVNPNAFPCSRAGMGISNLCVEPPYPVRRGTSAFVVWRIVDFRFGEFDSGDGRGFVGPIAREQRVEVPNVNAPRLIRLRWVDSTNQWREDSFVIQVTDAPTPIP